MVVTVATSNLEAVPACASAHVEILTVNPINPKPFWGQVVQPLGLDRKGPIKTKNVLGTDGEDSYLACQLLLLGALSRLRLVGF